MILQNIVYHFSILKKIDDVDIPSFKNVTEIC